MVWLPPALQCLPQQGQARQLPCMTAQASTAQADPGQDQPTQIHQAMRPTDIPTAPAALHTFKEQCVICKGPRGLAALPQCKRSDRLTLTWRQRTCLRSLECIVGSMGRGVQPSCVNAITQALLLRLAASGPQTRGQHLAALVDARRTAVTGPVTGATTANSKGCCALQSQGPIT